MTERLVSYVEPRLRKHIVWSGIAVSIALGLLVRLMIGNEPFLVITAMLVPFAGMFLLLNLLTASEKITVAERTRRFNAEVPYWERVLLRAMIFGFGFAVVRVEAEHVNTLKGVVIAVVVFTVVGLAFGLTQEWISQWAQRRVVRYAHRHWLLR
jgi:hypothetical protein